MALPKKAESSFSAWIRPCVCWVRKNLLFLTAFGIFLYLFSCYLRQSGELAIIGDSRYFFSILNYYLNAFYRGAYPFWDSFNVLGRPGDIFLRMFGEFNPFYHLFFWLQRGGLSVGWSYLMMISLMFVSGVLAFYGFCLSLFKNRLAAQAGMFILMFSFLSTETFCTPTQFLLAVPAIWFFYFLVRFFQTYQPAYLYGLAFSVMMTLVTNIPFYLLIAISLTLLGLLIFYPVFLWKRVIQLGAFIKENKGAVALSVFSVIIGILPGLLWFVQAKSGEFFANWRQASSEGEHVTHITLDMINASLITARYFLGDFFAYLERAYTSHPYLPVFGVFLLFWGTIVKPTKKLIVIFFVGVMMLIISLGSATPVHAWLYNHVFFFRLFRNLQFFLWFILGSGLLLGTGCLAALLDTARKSLKEKAGTHILLTALHILTFFLLKKFSGIHQTIYITLFLSWAFFTGYFYSSFFRKWSLTPWILAGIILIQPIYVWSQLDKNIESTTYGYTKSPHSYRDSKPEFEMMRPAVGEGPQEALEEGWGHVRDTSGLEYQAARFTGLHNTYQVINNAPRDLFEEYVRYKFIVYDQVWQASDKDSAMKRFIQNLQANRNEAVLSSQHSMEGISLSRNESSPWKVSEASEELSPEDFEINSLTVKTNFKENKFLVYNDAYHSKWKVFIDEKEVLLYEANGAFKGVFVPAGEHVIRFQFQSKMMHALYIFIAFYFVAMAGFVLWRLIRTSSKEGSEEI